MCFHKENIAEVNYLMSIEKVEWRCQYYLYFIKFTNNFFFQEFPKENIFKSAAAAALVFLSQLLAWQYRTVAHVDTREISTRDLDGK